MNTTMSIVVVIIVLLITALVVVTVFGNSLLPVADFGTQRNLCSQQGAASCATTGNLPPTWGAPLTYTQGGVKITADGGCSDAKLLGCDGCGTCGFSVPTEE